MAAKKKVLKKATKKVTAGAPAKELAAPATATVHTPIIPQASTQKVNKAGQAALRTYLGQMKSKGGGTVVLASEAFSTYALRRPSGIMQLDLDTGGGMPAGGLSTIAGPDGTGKSELLYLYFAQHQRLYGEDSRLALAHTEGQFDFWRAKRMGVQVSLPKTLIEERREIRHQRGQPDLTADEIRYLQHGVGDIVFFHGASGEEILESVIAAVRSTAFGIIGIDSMQGLMPRANSDKEMDEESKRAAFATMVTKFMTHYIPLSAGIETPNYTTLLAVSQVRSNPDKGSNPYAPDFIVQLAKAMKHYHLIELTLTTGSQIRKQISGAQVTIGKELKWKVTKGKAGAHDNVFGATSLIYPEYTTHGQSVDCVSSTITTGVRYGVIREAPNGYVYIMRGNQQTNLDPVANFGMLESAMRLDPEYENAIRQEILLAANLDCRYR